MKLISFFSGCGGMDLGFILAGFGVVYANDINKDAASTYFYNIGHIDRRSIYDVDNLPAFADGIIGGPPCQSWSNGGAMRGKEDNNGKLFWKFIDLIDKLGPRFFVAENVAGIFAQRNAEALSGILHAFQFIGYHVVPYRVNASDYGIAQDRDRVFFVGFRNKKLADRFTMEPEKEPAPKLRDVLPPEINTPDSFEWYEGGFSPRYMSRNRIRGWNEQSFTITATARHIPLHPSSYPMIKKGPDEWEFSGPYRRLSVRDCARIQTFPDSFYFVGNIESKYRQIGNAVPPKLAYKLAKSIKEIL